MHHREVSQLAEPPDGGMYESLPLALAEFDGAWTCLRVNRAFAALAGLPAETLIGRSIGTLPYPFARHVVPLVEQTLASPPVQTEVEIVDEFPCRPGSATHLILRLHPYSTSDVAATGWVLFASDVTEQRQTQTRLLESRALSLRVLDSLSTHVCMLTPDGTVVEANRPPSSCRASSSGTYGEKSIGIASGGATTPKPRTAWSRRSPRRAGARPRASTS